MLCCLIYCCIKQQRRQGTGAAGPAGPVTEVELTISGTDGMDCGCVDFPYSRVPPVLAHLFSQEEWERDVFTPLKNSLEYQNACCTCPCVIFFPLHLATLGLTAFPAHLMVTVSNRDVDTAVGQVCQDLSRRFSDRVGFGLHVSQQPAPNSKYCRAIVVYIKTEEQVAREAAAMEGMEMAAAKQAAARPTPASGTPFVAAETFAGALAGYVFKSGSNGMGYYLEGTASELPGVTEPAGITCTFNKPSADTFCGVMMQSVPNASTVEIGAVSPSGAAAGAGLTVGDLVESINGEKVTSSAQGATLLRSAVGEVKIIVTRPIPSSQKV